MDSTIAARIAPIALLAALFAALPAAASVHKCRAPDGRLTYQQLPCADSEQWVGSDIPSEYPAPNVAERERILQREADLMRRLESQRDRLSAEAIARLQRPDPVPVVVEVVAVPRFVPLRAWRPLPASRHAHRDKASGRLR